MKKSSSPYSSQSFNRKQNSVSGELRASRRTHPALNYFRKVAGVVAGFLRRRGKTDGIAYRSKKTNSTVDGVSFSSDISTGSSKYSSRFKSSSSYRSSSTTTSGLIGTISFTIADIRKATANFAPANRIGDGGFGTVYKGKLEDGSLIAVKRAGKNQSERRLSMEYKNEVLTLSKIEHLNLVRLFGYVEDRDERIIVVEYVGNGNLREHLDGTRGIGLELAERLDIAIDVAHAITYLHMYTDPPIIHRDIKSSNVLITEKFRAKVADFGFARLTAGDPAVTHISTNIKGTTGYLDPEYLKTYQLTEKSDVYSFGVLLVELVSGRYPIDHKRPINERVAIRWAMQKLREKECIQVMDPRLRRSPASNSAVLKILELADRCVSSQRPSRPSMKECAEILWRIRKDFKDISLSSSSSSHHSANFPTRDAKKKREETFGLEESQSCKFISA